MAYSDSEKSDHLWFSFLPGLFDVKIENVWFAISAVKYAHIIQLYMQLVNLHTCK